MNKYETIAEQIKEQIAAAMKEGQLALPTEEALCRQYACSRQTIRHALQLLKEQKLIASRQGSGYVATGLLADYEQNLVALLFPRDDDAEHAALLHRLKGALAKSGYQVAVFLHEGNAQKEREALLSLLRRPLRGLIVEPALSHMPSIQADLYERLRQQADALVFVKERNPNLSAYCGVFEKNAEGAYLATRYLLDNQHKQIAAMFQADSLCGPESFLGFSRAMLEAGLPIPQDHIGWFNGLDYLEIEREEENDFLKRFLQNRLSSCTAVLCQNDTLAYWLIKELQARSISVPQTVSVVSFGNSYICRLSRPALTAFGYEEETIVAEILNLFTRQLQKKRVRDVSLDWTLYERESTTL